MRILKRGKLGFNKATAQALVWGLWASTSPRSLRYTMRRLLQKRSQRARRELGGETILEWPVAGAEAARNVGDALL
jgi:hypothetical protein